MDTNSNDNNTTVGRLYCYGAIPNVKVRLIFGKKYHELLHRVRNSLLSQGYDGDMQWFDSKKEELSILTNAHRDKVILEIQEQVRGLATQEKNGTIYFTETPETAMLPEAQVSPIERDTRGRKLREAIEKETGEPVPDSLERYLEAIAASYQKISQFALGTSDRRRASKSHLLREIADNATASASIDKRGNIIIKPCFQVLNDNAVADLNAIFEDIKPQLTQPSDQHSPAVIIDLKNVGFVGKKVLNALLVFSKNHSLVLLNPTSELVDAMKVAGLNNSFTVTHGSAVEASAEIARRHAEQQAADETPRATTITISELGRNDSPNMEQNQPEYFL